MVGIATALRYCASRLLSALNDRRNPVVKFISRKAIFQMNTALDTAVNRVSVTDFYRSFVRFRIDLNITQPRTISQPPPFTLNNARFPLECVCQITRDQDAAAKTIEYVLGASCKAEQVHVRENIWHEPAADMCLIASRDEFLVIKSWDRNNRGVMLSPPTLGPQPERQAGNCSEAFTDMNIDLREASGQLLTTTEEIVAAVLTNRPLVSQTEFSLSDGSQVFLEYPVKVINASEREMFYQVDTGPILVPDVTAFDGKNAISALRLAFMAHNTLGCTEMLLNVPTEIAPGLSVNHYSKAMKISAINRMIAVD
jgi:hypothetical protein